MPPTVHSRGTRKSKARALSLSVVGSQAPLGAGFGNLFPSAVGNSLGSSTLGGIASGLFEKRQKKNPLGVALGVFFFKKKNGSQTALPLILIAFNATHLLFFTLRFQCGEVVVVRVCLTVLCALGGSLLLYNVPSAFTPPQKSCSCAQVPT